VRTDRLGQQMIPDLNADGDHRNGHEDRSDQVMVGEEQQTVANQETGADEQDRRRARWAGAS
jgi:hypothetical protein